MVGPIFGGASRFETKLLVLLGISCAAPDIDGLGYLLSADIYFNYHRGPTHSVIGAFLVCFTAVYVAAFLYNRYLRETDLSFSYRKGLPFLRRSKADSVEPGERIGIKTVLFIAFFGSFVHILLDTIGPLGVPLFWPITDAGYCLGLFYYVDPLMLLVTGFTASAVLFTRIERRRLFSVLVVSLIIMSSVVGVRLYERDLASEYGEPNPSMNPFTWYAVDDRNVSTITVHVIRFGKLDGTIAYSKPVYAQIQLPIDNVNEAISASRQSVLVDAFLKKSKYPIVDVFLIKGNYTVFWSDALLKAGGTTFNEIRVNVFSDGRIETVNGGK